MCQSSADLTPSRPCPPCEAFRGYIPLHEGHCFLDAWAMWFVLEHVCICIPLCFVLAPFSYFHPVLIPVPLSPLSATRVRAPFHVSRICWYISQEHMSSREDSELVTPASWEAFLENEALRPESISVPITCHTLSLTLTKPWHYRFAHSFSYSFFISTTWTLDPWLRGHFLVQCCITLTRKCGGHSINVCCLYGNMTRPEGNLEKRDLADTMGLGS